MGSIGLIKGQGHEKHGDDPTPRSLAVGVHGGGGPNISRSKGVLLDGRHGGRDP